MGIFGNAVYTIFKRPFIIIFLALIMPVICLIESFLLSIIFGVSSIGTGNIFESLVSIFRIMLGFMSDPVSIVKIIFATLFAIVVASILIGFLLAGYLYKVNNSLEGKRPERGEFITGAKMYFSKISLITLRVLGLGIIFSIFMMVAIVPALIITRSTDASKAGFLGATVFLDIITFGVFFFGFMFFRLYSFFWYPAAMNFENKPFTIGKHVVDKYFWNLVGRLFLFDLVFLVIQMIYLYGDYTLIKQGNGSAVLSVLIFMFNWIFKTVFFALFITYITSAFKIFSRTLKK